MSDTARDALARWIACQLPLFSYSELKTVAVRVERLAKAISDYGHLDLSTDRRIWKLERAYEGVDEKWYEDAETVFNHDPAFADVREQRRRERVKEFADAFDDSPTGEFSPVGNRNASSSASPISAALVESAESPQSVDASPSASAAPFLELDVGPERVLVPPFCEDCNAPVDLGHADGCAWTTIVPGKEGSAA